MQKVCYLCGGKPIAQAPAESPKVVQPRQVASLFLPAKTSTNL